MKFVEDDDEQYMVGSGRPPELRTALLSSGKICFRTCFRRAYIPASYVLKLAEHDYENDALAGSFKVALEHWLLVEILSAIGQHSIL